MINLSFIKPTVDTGAIKIKNKDIPSEMKKWFDVEFGRYGIALTEIYIMPISESIVHFNDMMKSTVAYTSYDTVSNPTYNKYGTRYAVLFVWKKKNQLRKTYPKDSQGGPVWIVGNNLRKDDNEDVVSTQKYLSELNFLFKLHTWMRNVARPLIKENIKS